MALTLPTRAEPTVGCALRPGGTSEAVVDDPLARPGAHPRPQDEPLDADRLARSTPDAAIAILYQSHWTGLVRLATLLTRDGSVAEEIVQEAFVALHRRWARLADPLAAPGYLRTSVVNGARSALRHRGVTERYRQPGPPEPAGPEELAVRATQDAEVLDALRTLSRRQQEVLVLRYYADLSEVEIAATLGLTKGAVKSHAHRGIAALRKALAGNGRV